MKFNHAFCRNMRNVVVGALREGKAWNFYLLKELQSYNIVDRSLLARRDILWCTKEYSSLFIVSASFLKIMLIKFLCNNVNIEPLQAVQCGLLCVILKTNAYGKLKCNIKNVTIR